MSPVTSAAMTPVSLDARSKLSATILATYRDGVGDHAGKAAAEGIVGRGAIGATLGAGTAVLGAGGLVLLGPVGLLAGAVIGGASTLLLGHGVDSDRAVASENAVDNGRS